ncbi:MAG: class I SAM-dependent methyltransferase, partial [Clostridia bacterium]|nr:class I SAM-dependent methyltransferase [Clostridia bacterium]
LGCGWGPIGITVAKRFPEAEVLMCDVNARAVALAEKNIAANGVQNAAAILSDGFANIEGMFQTILTNPPIRAGKSVIYGFFKDAAAHLKPDGCLILVIRKQQGAESAERYLKTIYESVLRLDRKKGYWILKCSGPLTERAEQ